MFHNKDILIDNITQKGNKVLIWGAFERNDYVLEFFRHNGINVVGYIDGLTEKPENGQYVRLFNNLPVFDKDIIKSDDFFVYVGMINTYHDVISHLESNNYNEFSDYWYPCKAVILDGSRNYPEDMYGNEYIGENYNIKIILFNGGKLYIDKKCKFDDLTIMVTYMSEIRIGSNVRFTGSAELFSKYSSVLDIGSDITADTNLSIRSLQNSKIIIGRDCMMSQQIAIKAGNSHTIFDIESNRNLCMDGKTITIGEHVWLSHRVFLLNGCEIGNGSIVGANTFVNKKFPANCSIAGNPARIIKKAVAWRRESYPYLDNYNDFAKYDFR